MGLGGVGALAGVACCTLACYVPIDTGPCGAVVTTLCTQCTAVYYTPNSSYCDSRDGQSGGTDCHIVTVPCVQKTQYYNPINCPYGCGGIMMDIVTGQNGTVPTAVVTGSCIVSG